METLKNFNLTEYNFILSKSLEIIFGIDRGAELPKYNDQTFEKYVKKNLDTINKTNYELGAPQREMDMFNEQLASQTLVDQAAAKLLAENEIKLRLNKLYDLP